MSSPQPEPQPRHARRQQRWLLVAGLAAVALVSGGRLPLFVAASAAAPAEPASQRRGAKQEFTITVTEKGFDPSDILLKRGEPTRLTFVRTASATCAKELLIPGLRVRRPLPVGAEVSIQFTPRDTGDIAFTCGQHLFEGTLVVE